MLETIEGLWLAEFLRRSVWAYPIVNATHILAFGTLVVTAMLIDARLLGAGQRLALNDVVLYLRRIAIIALLVALATGFLLFSVQPETYAGNPVFWTKLILLGLALFNAALFVLLRRHELPLTPLTTTMALLSIVLWIGVVGAGRAIAFFD